MAKEAGVNIKKMAVGRKDLFILSIDDIHVDRNWNERNLEREDVRDHITKLALSISKIGIQQPLTVARHGDKILLTDGYCRIAAVKLAVEKFGADIKGVPVRVEDKGSNEADHVLSMLIRNDGLALTMPEQARVIKRLLAFDWSKNEIAEKTGRSLTHVDNCIMLLEADHKIMKYLDNGDISARFTLDIIRKKREQALPIIEKAISKAKAAGKKKVTQRTASTGKKKIMWGKHGPELMRLLDELEKTCDVMETVPDSIGDIATWYKGYKEDHKLKLESDTSSS